MIRIISSNRALSSSLAALFCLASNRNYIKPITDESQRDAPIVRTMKKLSNSMSKDELAILSPPGHKNSKGVDKEYAELWGEKALDNDFYSVSVMDNLFNPKEEIKEALRLATELYKTKATFFSSCGTSPLIAAMISATVSRGEKILIPRHSHKSTTLGLRLSGAIPIYVQPIILDDRQLLLNNTPEQIEEALNLHPDVKAVLITSPTAQGINADLKAIEKIVHSKGKIFIVDEAWGSLMPFNDRYPRSALEVGADLVVHSNHKDACAVVGSGILHVNSDKVDIGQIKRQINGLLSTSPSFWILSSQDACRRKLAYEGFELAQKAADMGNLAREEISKIPGFSVLDQKFCDFPGCHSLSPNRVTVFMDNLGITGWELSNMLIKKYGIYTIYPSFSDFALGGSYASTTEDYQRLFKALNEISKKHFNEEHENNREYIRFPKIPPLVLSPHEANNFGKERRIPLEDSLGKIAAQTICAYPPGIPILVEGEMMTENTLEFIEQYARQINTDEKKSGGLLLGLEDNNKKISIIDK